tara:strand:- start:130 stop:402 length:273 start_codon:yes stop_codon:yes gene_type:complete
MDEYVIDVMIDNKPDELKTFCGSIYAAVDSMLGIDMVDEIKTITRTVDNKIWDVKDMDMKYLRQLRQEMDESLLADAFKNVEDLYIDGTH